MGIRKIDAVEATDALCGEAGLPAYSTLLRFAQLLAYPDANELLLLEDYRNIARNAVQPDGVRIEVAA